MKKLFLTVVTVVISLVFFIFSLALWPSLERVLLAKMGQEISSAGNHRESNRPLIPARREIRPTGNWIPGSVRFVVGTGIALLDLLNKAIALGGQGSLVYLKALYTTKTVHAQGIAASIAPDHLRCRDQLLEFEHIHRLSEERWNVLGPEERPEEVLMLANRAIEIYKSEVLAAGKENLWTTSCRERLQNMFVRLVIRAGDYLQETEEYKEAAELYQKALEIDGTVEEFYQNLMECYQNLGLHTEAMALYHRCQEILSILGIEPSPKTREIYQNLLNGDRLECPCRKNKTTPSPAAGA